MRQLDFHALAVLFSGRELNKKVDVANELAGHSVLPSDVQVRILA